MALQEPPIMSRCQLVHHEVSKSTVERVRDVLFDQIEEQWNPEGGSPWQKWYRQNTVVSDHSDRRLIAWKKSAPFEAEFLFFRSLDTGRFLPMHLADFSVQVYAHASHWEFIERTKEGRKGWIDMTLCSILPELLVLRNFLDFGGADIPLLVVNWESDIVLAVMKYWVERSDPDWSPSSCKRDLDQHVVASRLGLQSHHRPCLFQADLCVRALLSDPEVGYVPPFIVIHQAGLPDGKTRVLFTRPTSRAPLELIQSFPIGCGSRGCEETHCGFWDLDNHMTLHDPSPIVRAPHFNPESRTRCNLWMCKVEHDEGGTSGPKDKPLMRCKRCREVFYCSGQHQALDWTLHKTVCEKR